MTAFAFSWFVWKEGGFCRCVYAAVNCERDAKRKGDAHIRLALAPCTNVADTKLAGQCLTCSLSADVLQGSDMGIPLSLGCLFANSILNLHERLYLRIDSFCIQAVFMDKLRGGAGFSEYIIDADF